MLGLVSFSYLKVVLVVVVGSEKEMFEKLRLDSLTKEGFLLTFHPAHHINQYQSAWHHCLQPELS